MKNMPLPHVDALGKQRDDTVQRDNDLQKKLWHSALQNKSQK